MTDRLKICLQCKQGRLLYRNSRTYGHPDGPYFQAVSLYECDHCGAIEERDVS